MFRPCALLNASLPSLMMALSASSVTAFSLINSATFLSPSCSNCFRFRAESDSGCGMMSGLSECDTCALKCLLRGGGRIPEIPVVLQQLGAARDFASRIIGSIESLRRSCEAFQMPTHRNVLPSNSRTGNVVIIIVHAFLIREH